MEANLKTRDAERSRRANLAAAERLFVGRPFNADRLLKDHGFAVLVGRRTEHAG